MIWLLADYAEASTRVHCAAKCYPYCVIAVRVRLIERFVATKKGQDTVSTTASSLAVGTSQFFS
jgi:hypothetical protein